MSDDATDLSSSGLSDSMVGVSDEVEVVVVVDGGGGSLVSSSGCKMGKSGVWCDEEDEDCCYGGKGGSKSWSASASIFFTSVAS